jgi:hypothetical protein
MASSKSVRPPWWLKPANKLFIQMSRGRHARRVRLVELSADDARPLLRVFPTEVPRGVGFMKRTGLVSEGRPEEFEALAGRCAVFRLDPV